MTIASGVTALLKPPGVSSHDVVQAVRRITGCRRVGHTGTLDVGAAGVLVVCVGAATRLVPFLQAGRKAYRVELTLGRETDTHDAGGETAATCDAFALELSDVERAAQGLVGRQQQVPPLSSAVQVGGQRLYRLARAGGPEAQSVTPPTRWVTVYSAAVLRAFAAPRPASGPTLLGPGDRVLVDLVCSKGTYVRTWVGELGRRLGCRAYMSFLVRTQNGPFDLAEAATLPEFAARWGQRGAAALTPPAASLGELSAVRLDAVGVARVGHGQPVGPGRGALGWDPRADGAEEPVRLLGPDGHLVAVGRAVPRTAGAAPEAPPSGWHDGPHWRPVCVLESADG